MAAQQSWTAWLLDAYASAVSTNTTDSSQGSSQSEATTPDTQSKTPSPYGPYVRTGRGGAGNFTWQNSSPAERTNDELEAQKPSTLSERRQAAANIEHLDTGAAVKSKAAQRPAAQYVRVGRGYVQSNEIQTSPRSASFNQSFTSPVVPTPPIAHPGRGGAGNHAAAAELNDKIESEKQKKERVEAEERRDKIEEQVQSAVPAPPDAWLGGRRRSADLPVNEV